ncbi:sodium-dependent transporter [Thermoplasmatales archaeon ex4484_36]|nr:MAG: sodium-dependent transporter [Thermoplasmatales archaeon ex4484_36]RLF54214.1 MAG: sodium-dependent transporter [Thermoplasmata archaeon]HDD60352.1 sodium-dependent transporter [Euryarchaeota archaeon]RLF71334.1 MAG: sodium-dependent transporter [Thermoplasmata archaeon]RLF74435.1 MAG: sodium-dependent transporter [Thermoplasmata archaeon]
MERKETFRSRWGLVLTSLGAAIGTGNIWRFPKETAANGGGSFLLPWIIFLFIWSIPILMVEFAVGKKTRRGTVGAFMAFLGRKKGWMGAFMAFVSSAIGFYYAVVMGWVLRYVYVALRGDVRPGVDTESLWFSFLTSPLQVIFFQILAILITTVIVMKGIEKGIERINLFLIPALFLIMIFLAIRAVTLPGASRGIVYLFTPRGEQLGEASTWISALAQSAWSCSAGMGMALTYGVYMRRKEDTTLNAVLTGLGNNSASLIVGIAVFSTVFALSPTPAAADAALQEGGTGLTFIYLTALFATMPFGSLVAFFFFLATAFAALTSMLSTYELAVRNFMDFGLSRKRAVLYMSAATFLLGLPSAAVVLNMGGRPVPVILENQDHVWGLALLLTGLMLYLLLRSYGVRRFRENFINSRWSDIRVGRWFDVLFNYVVPVEIAVLFVWYFYQTLTGPSENWWVSGPIGLALMLIQWAGVIVLLRYLVNRYSHKIDLSDVDVNLPLDEEDRHPVRLYGGYEVHYKDLKEV